ncbi:uncharacterized protein ACRADG_005242 [Cochliomyia hominivorax]
MRYLFQSWTELTLLLMLVGTLINPLKADSNRINAQYLFRKTFKDIENTAGKIYSQESKTLSENLLKEEKLKNSLTPIIREFRRNITKYLDLYPVFENFGFYHDLVLKFDKIVGEFYLETGKDDESQYISQLLRKYNYNVINDKYEQAFLKFVQQKLFNNFENFSKNLEKNEDLRKFLIKWLKKVEKCNNYDCALDLYESLNHKLNTPTDFTIIEIQDKLYDINAFFIQKAYKILKQLKNDSNLTKLQTNCQNDFMQAINDFIRKYDSKSYSLNQVFETLHHNITLKYYKNSKIPQSDQDILKSLFKKYGYVKWQKIHENLLNDLIKNQLPEEMEHFKEALVEQALKKENDLFEWYKKVKALKSYEKKVEAFGDLKNIK